MVTKAQLETYAAQFLRDNPNARQFPIYAAVVKTGASRYHFTVYIVPSGQTSPVFITNLLAELTGCTFKDSTATLYLGRKVSGADKSRVLESRVAEHLGDKYKMHFIFAN